jgi:hypothetical protein
MISCIVQVGRDLVRHWCFNSAFAFERVEYPKYLLRFDVRQQGHDQSVNATQKHVTLVGVRFREAFSKVWLGVLRQKLPQTFN